MEIGTYGWKRDVDFIHHGLSLAGPQFIQIPASALNSYGLLNLGDAPFDGVSSGHFQGFSNPTAIALNFKSASRPNIFTFQIDGGNIFTIDGYGTINDYRDPAAETGRGVLNLGFQFFSGAGQFAGDANGTYLAMNSQSGFTGKFIDCQLAANSKFWVDYVGNVSLDGSLYAGGTGSPFPLDNSITKKSSDSTMTSNTAFVDGPTVSCVTGTWLLIACCTVVCGTTAGTLTGKLWDGTTVISSSETRQVASQASSITLAGVVAPGSTTTYKMSVATTTGATNASTLKAAAVNNGAGNNATWITAVRIG